MESGRNLRTKEANEDEFIEYSRFEAKEFTIPKWLQLIVAILLIGSFLTGIVLLAVLVFVKHFNL